MPSTHQVAYTSRRHVHQSNAHLFWIFGVVLFNAPRDVLLQNWHLFTGGYVLLHVHVDWRNQINSCIISEIVIILINYTVNFT